MLRTTSLLTALSSISQQNVRMPLRTFRRWVALFVLESVQLIGMGNVSPDPTWEMPVHTHQCWEFVYFLRGTGRIEMPHATIRPQQYHVVIYPPGLPHSEVSDPINPEETIFLSVDAQGTPPQGAHLLLPDPKGEMGWLCQHMFAEVSSSGISRLPLAYCQAFLCLVDNAWDTALPVKHDAVDFAIQYIHANYCSDITLDELANAACVNKAHLSRRFNARLGTSPLRYLRQFRTEIAKRLLLTTDLPVHEVAAQAGFADPLYFSRVIKSATGRSPSGFRKESK